VGKNSIEHAHHLEYTNVITNTLLLVLSYALSNPGDITDFLYKVSFALSISEL
jgi:hypothetical protein